MELMTDFFYQPSVLISEVFDQILVFSHSWTYILDVIMQYIDILIVMDPFCQVYE